jgi:hypothetical protein
MEGRFSVTFDDGTVEEVLAENATAAKAIARTKRVRDLDPAGSMPKADVMGHGSVKIAKVVEIVAAILLSVATYAALAGLLYLDTLSRAHLGVTVHAGVLEVMAASGTAIGATLAALAAVTGDSLQIPFFPETKKGWLLQLWADVQVAGTLRVRSAKMHDNVSGIRFDTIISDTNPLLPWGSKQPLYSGDLLNIDLAGSAVAGDIEYVVLLRYFEELSAQHSRLITAEEAYKRTVNISAVENTISTGATAAWAGSEAINAEIDQFHARTDYALLGYVVDTEAPAVAWRGPDTANVRCGGPGLETERGVTQNWFADLSKVFGMPLVPLFNADNKAATNIDALQDENGADTTVISVYAELSK